ncbi:MAG: alpha/beta hydrolase family protein [Myxococcaceae bacterium]
MRPTPFAQGPHWLDVAFAWQASRRPFFREGWGDERLLALAAQGRLWERRAPEPVEPRWGVARRRRAGLSVRDGAFASPQPGLPDGVDTAHLRWLSGPGHSPTACLVLAGSREEGFGLREAIYAPLVPAGVDLLLLENPFSGLRRAPGQPSAAVRTVSDHLLLNLAMVREAQALLGWLVRAGYKRRAVAGYSMGGFMAALVAALTPEPLAVAALAAGTTPAPVYTSGLLSRSVDFTALGETCGGAEKARERLAGLFGLADVSRFSAPARPEAAVVVGCRQDGYVAQLDTEALAAHWAGSSLRWLKAGHISALLLHRRELRGAVAEALGRLG